MIKEDGSFLLMIKRRKRKDEKEEETDHPAHDPILLTSPSLHPLHTPLSSPARQSASPPHTHIPLSFMG